MTLKAVNALQTAVYATVPLADPVVQEALLPPSPSDLPAGGLGLDWGLPSSGEEAKALSFRALGPPRPRQRSRLCPRAEPPPSSDRSLSSLCLRAQRGSWPGRSAGATGAALQTAFHGHFFQGEPQPHPSPSGSEVPEEEAAEKNQRAAAAPQAPGDLW